MTFLKLLSKAIDAVITTFCAIVFVAWLAGFVKVYTLMGKVFIMIG